MNKTLKRILLSFTVGMCFMLVILLAVLASKRNSLALDTHVANFFKDISTKGIVKFLKIFTHIGSIYCLATIILSFFFFKNKTYGLIGAIFLTVSSLTGVAIKYIIKRPRPVVTHLEEIGYSFPSAHAMLTFFTLSFAIYVVYKLVKNKAIKISISIILGIIILVVSFSRIILGVHYFTDILAGWCMAIPFLIGAILMNEHFLKNPIKTNNRLM